MENSEPRPSVESSGRTVEEAIQRALKELEARRSEVEIEVLTEGSRGMLGFVLEEARVRVTLRHPRQEGGPPDPGQVAQEVLEKLLVGMGIHGRITRLPSSQPDIPAVLDIRGRDLGILIGRRGETLRALQYLTRMMTSHRLKRWVPVLVDVDSYRARRERSLTEMARRMAEQAVAQGQPVTLEPMPAHERRIIHLTLRDHPEVVSQSTGEDEDRCVVIYPKSIAPTDISAEPQEPATPPL